MINTHTHKKKVSRESYKAITQLIQIYTNLTIKMQPFRAALSRPWPCSRRQYREGNRGNRADHNSW